MTVHGNGNGTPVWVKSLALLIGTIGLPGFIALYAIGVFDAFLPTRTAAHEMMLQRHDEDVKRDRRLLILICQGLWKESLLMQSECTR